ncbi:hypothetical protein SAMN06295912_107134 [Sphingomonas laterariae]|uniref:Uncharacterized protein n=1 Tax=Edaphosphingomonas laterariae TaxID=861865 RepID=A0A239EY46_9SPHN|nr:hypothetical protein SAMN06295912_107134 [Sphingomonas laterariae]
MAGLRTNSIRLPSRPRREGDGPTKTGKSAGSFHGEVAAKLADHRKRAATRPFCEGAGDDAIVICEPWSRERHVACLCCTMRTGA